MPLRMASADPTRRFTSENVIACHDHLESPWWQTLDSPNAAKKFGALSL
jgi:hypothetical protein